MILIRNFANLKKVHGAIFLNSKDVNIAFDVKMDQKLAKLNYNKMEETQKILKQMGFINLNSNVWKSEWFGVFILLETATPEELGKFIYTRGLNN